MGLILEKISLFKIKIIKFSKAKFKVCLVLGKWFLNTLSLRESKRETLGEKGKTRKNILQAYKFHTEHGFFLLFIAPPLLQVRVINIYVECISTECWLDLNIEVSAFFWSKYFWRHKAPWSVSLEYQSGQNYCLFLQHFIRLLFTWTLRKHQSGPPKLLCYQLRKHSAEETGPAGLAGL